MNAQYSVIAERSMRLGSSAQIEYNQTTSTLRCKFNRIVNDITWYFVTLVVRSGESSYTFVIVGSQYHQSAIQMTSEENYYVNELTLNDRTAPFGPYYCGATDTYSFGSSYFATSKTIDSAAKVVHSDMIFFHAAVGFVYHNKSYINNSVILIQPEDFSTQFQPVVLCVTNNANCCYRNDGSSNWYYPNGGQVHRNSSDQECSLQTGNVGFVNRQYNALIIQRSSFIDNNCFGLYSSLIPDRHGNPQRLYLGVYDARCK